MSVISDLIEIKERIEELEELNRERQRMSDIWNDPDGDPCDQAICDPGLQYEKDMEVESLIDDIMTMFDMIRRDS